VTARTLGTDARSGQRKSKRGLLIIVLLVGALTAHTLFRQDAGRGETQVASLSPSTTGGRVDERAPNAPSQIPLLRGERAARGAGRPDAARDTSPREQPPSLLLPLRISLELESAAHLARVPSSPALGSGRTARLAGQIAGARGEPLAAKIHIVAGPNCGRVACTDPAGRFHITSLHPGLAIVEVRRSGSTLVRREVRLRAGGERHFHVGFGRPARVAGRVVDVRGQAIAAARVRVDGQRVRTDAAGHFEVGAVAGGRVLVEVEALGFAARRRELDVVPGSSIAPDELELRLEDEARLRLTLSGAGDATTPARAWILPAALAAERTTPWYLFEALEFRQGLLEVRGLPSGLVRVHVDRAGARLRGGGRAVLLASGATHTHTLQLEPAPSLSGRILRAGVPVRGATVELHAADPLLASRMQLGFETERLDDELVPLFAPVVTRTTSDVEGNFHVNDGARFSPWRRLVVTGPDGRVRIERAVGPTERTVEVDLAAPSGDAALLVIVPSQRRADLPYELFVHGQLREAGSLRPGEDLAIDALVAGRWRIRVIQGALEIVRTRTIELDGEVRLPVELVGTRGAARPLSETQTRMVPPPHASAPAFARN